MTVRIDTDIPLYSPTAPPGAVGDADSHLSLAGQARPDPYHLEGARAVVRGSERAGVASVIIDGATAVEDLVADAGLVVNVVVAPALVRRECVGGRGNVLETALALPTLPMAAFQWSTENGLEMAFTVLPDHDDLRYHLRARTLRAELPASPAQGVDVLIHPEPEKWRVVEGTDGGLQVHVVVTAPGPVTLLIASGTPEITARALDAGRHLAVHATRSATDHDPTNVEALLPVTGVAVIDGGVGWATVRLGGALRRGDPRGDADWFWTGVGALASGDEAGALQAADRLRGAPTVSVWGTPQASGPALATFLTARATLLSGNEAPAQRSLEHVDPERLGDVREASDPDAWAWWALALDTLADALRYGASEAEVQAVRDLAATSAGRPSRVLPMAGSGPRPGSAHWLRSLLRGEGLAGTGPVHGGTAEDPLTAWIALASGDVEGGYGAWRAMLTHGLSGRYGPRGSWRPPAGGAAEAVSTLAFGLLRLEPDAPSGRIRVAPVLPAHLKQFRVRGIRVGDARLELSHERADGTHRFHLNALDGRVPPMVILEPSLPIASLGAVRVDGAPAEITSEPHDPGGAAPTRTRLRVQIPLDGPRVLEVDEG